MSKKSIEQSGSSLSGGPLFVVGVPRSGTSLLYTLLNQHPDIGLMFDADLPFLWPLFLKRRTKSQWLERWNLWNKSPERHRIDISKIPKEVSDVRTATEAAYREYAGHKSARIWGDKSPDQYDSLVTLADYFPSARFVIIWRDPADVCRSMIRARKGSLRFRQGGLTHRALLGCQHLGVQRNRLLKRGIQIHELQFEDLIHSPIEELQKICKFLDIPFHSKMASLKDADRSAIHPAEHNALVTGDIIVASRKSQPEVLSLKLRRKIERYKLLWRQRNLDWAMLLPSAEGDITAPSLSEQVTDQLRYRLLRTWDLFVVFVYCFFPLRFLTAYRAWKGHTHLNLTWQDYVRKCTECESFTTSEDSANLSHAQLTNVGASVQARKGILS